MQSVHLILLSNGKWDSVHPKDTILTETVTPLKSTPLFIQPNNVEWLMRKVRKLAYVFCDSAIYAASCFHMITEPIARVDIYVITKTQVITLLSTKLRHALRIW